MVTTVLGSLCWAYNWSHFVGGDHGGGAVAIGGDLGLVIRAGGAGKKGRRRWGRGFISLDTDVRCDR